MALVPDLERRLHEQFKDIAVFDTLRFEFLAMDPGSARVRVPRLDAFNGVYRTFHGGMLTTVADCAAWIALVTQLGPETHLTTSDIHVRFLEPCFTEVVADARVLKLGRTLCPVHVDLSNSAGTRVAVAQVTYFKLNEAPVETS